MKILPRLTKLSVAERRAAAYKSMIREEAKIGGELFGPIPKGHRREFFCLDERTWVWHEEWKDEAGKQQVMTTRYDVRPHDILKVQGDSHHYQPISLEEALNLYRAVGLYERRTAQLYAV